MEIENGNNNYYFEPSFHFGFRIELLHQRKKEWKISNFRKFILLVQVGFYFFTVKEDISITDYY